MFVVTCKDKAGALELRMANRPAHIEYLKAHLDKVVLGGAMLTDDRQSPIGSTLVLDFQDRADLDAFLAEDPYVKSGLFEQVTIVPFRKALP